MVVLKAILLAALLAVSIVADGSSEKPEVKTLTQSSYVLEDGYNFVYKTSDGVSRQEEGSLITVGEHQGIGIKGSYSYVAPDGQEYQVTYTADQNGYKPVLRVVTPGSQ